VVIFEGNGGVLVAEKRKEKWLSKKRKVAWYLAVDMLLASRQRRRILEQALRQLDSTVSDHD
jgi:hypothetical protein